MEPWIDPPWAYLTWYIIYKLACAAMDAVAGQPGGEGNWA